MAASNLISQHPFEKGNHAMEQLQERLKDFSDEHILQEFFNHKSEYQPQALELLQKEIEKRNIDLSRFSAAINILSPHRSPDYNPDSFLKFSHVFSSTDILLLIAILKENKVVFYMDNAFESTIPIENQALKTYTIHVQEEFVEKAHQIIDEHFEKSDGKYLSKITTPKDRLKAFSFNELHLSEEEDRELLEVTLSADERKTITLYARRLLSEVDQIEQSGDRVIFYYDSIEELLNLINSCETLEIHKSQVCAILEILQIYCDDSQFPDFLNVTIDNILRFFINS